MKEYKLIKSYPGSLVLGTKVNYSETHQIYNYNGGDFYSELPKHQVENLPEYWEEIIENPKYVKCIEYNLYGGGEIGKIYKVVSLRSHWYILEGEKEEANIKRFIPATKEEYDAQFIIPKTYQILSFKWDGELTTLRDNGYYVYERNNPEGCPDGKGATLQHMLNEEIYPGCVIYSVKRLSDSVVFTIGDKIGADVFKSNTVEIFDIFKDNIYVITSSGSTPLHLIYHAKTPLFTTEDGVEIFEGDKYWFVGKDSEIKSLDHAQTYSDAAKGLGDKYGKKYFSTKEKAQDFISVNIPKYSKKQVFDALQSAGLANFNYNVLLYLGE